MELASLSPLSPPQALSAKRATAGDQLWMSERGLVNESEAARNCGAANEGALADMVVTSSK
jgi:hypothetical protein